MEIVIFSSTMCTIKKTSSFFSAVPRIARSSVCWGGKNTCLLELFNKANFGVSGAPSTSTRRSGGTW